MTGQFFSTKFKPVQSCCCCKSTHSLSWVRDRDPGMDRKISYDVLISNYSFRVRPQPVQFLQRGHSSHERAIEKHGQQSICLFCCWKPSKTGKSCFARSHVQKSIISPVLPGSFIIVAPHAQQADSLIASHVHSTFCTLNIPLSV